MARPLKNPKNVSSSSSLCCLPDEIVLDCLVRVPRRNYENLSRVSKRLRSLVRSPELHRLRSLLHKDSVYVCICERDNHSTDPAFLWFTLRRTTTTEYRLVPVPFPSRSFMFRSSAVAVDSEIYFVGGNPKPTELWILDTRSGKLRQGPMMREPEFMSVSAVGVANGKMYVSEELIHGPVKKEVLDLESQTWEITGVPARGGRVDIRAMADSSVTLEGKLYALFMGSITVHNLRQQGRRKEKMPIDNLVLSMCLADNLLFACFSTRGLMWLDTKRNIWKVVTGDVQTLRQRLFSFQMAEYYGKLVVFWREANILFGTSFTKKKKKEEKILCALVALDRVGEEVRGTFEWSGVVATAPYVCQFVHCLVASD